MQGIGAAGLLLLLVTGQLMIKNVVGFCIAFSNAFGLIAGKQAPLSACSTWQLHDATEQLCQLGCCRAGLARWMWR